MNGIVLAGGKSTRMGTDKAVLDLGGKKLTEIVVETIGAVVDEVVVVTNSPERFTGLSARLTSDVEPGGGPLGGILSGLLISEQWHNLVVACDMPFLNVDLLRFMQQQADGYDVVIPHLGDLFEPLHAIYSKACVEPIRALLRQQNLRITDFLGEVRVRYIDKTEIDQFDPSHLSFFNINRPEDLERAREEIARRTLKRSTE